MKAHLDDVLSGAAWWKSLQESERYYWIDKAGSTVPAEAWVAYKLSDKLKVIFPKNRRKK